jgi:2-phospho-L-lactate guanylyltransferase (CobY/MobA/RfbA family)
MLLRPPGGFALHYGRGSAAAHRHAAEEADFVFASLENDELALDLDTRADIERLLASEKGRTSAAGRLLRSWGFGASTRVSE